MKGAQLLKLLKATRVTSSGVVSRLPSENGWTSVFQDGPLRGMATAADRKPTKIAVSADEKSTESRVSDSKSSQSPRSTKTQQVWWRPDPVTGTWVPESSDVVTSSESTISSSGIVRIRSESTDATEDKVWWTSMEEIPDMDRPKDV